jgi:hypothetical protein
LRHRRCVVLRNAALVKISQELDVVRLGDGEILVAGEYRLVVRGPWNTGCPAFAGHDDPKVLECLRPTKKPALPPAFVSHYSAFSAFSRIP